MKKVFIFLIILVFGLCLPVFTFADVTEENPLLPNTLMPGMIEGTGTHFEVKDSKYLNIVLDSSAVITLRLESVPEMVTMHIEPASEATLTQITIGGFQPSTTYYKYEDDYHNEVAFTTNENGGYSWTQDLSQPHLVFIQPRKSTKCIKDNATGGDCYLIGNWDSATKTCTLTTDVNETIQIDSNHIALDGNGHTITGTGTGFGVYLYGRTSVTIKNLNVKDFTHGIYLLFSSNNIIIDNTVSNNTYGIYLYNSSNNTLTGNIASNNSIGIRLYYSSNNTLTGNIASNNSTGIYLYHSIYNTLTGNAAQENFFMDLNVRADSDTYCNNVIQNTIGSGGRPIKYFNSSVNLQNEVLSQLILCNADYSNIENVTIEGSETLKNNGLFVILTNYSNITNANSSNNSNGIYLYNSSNNTLTGNTACSSAWYDFYCYSCSILTESDNICDTPDGCPISCIPCRKVDTIPPTVTVTATPNILWPPNHKMVDVKIYGSAIDEESGIASVVITVADEYGIHNMTVPSFESTIQIEAWRDGTDKDGRAYTITVVATDKAGNQSTAITEVIVPHDMRK